MTRTGYVPLLITWNGAGWLMTERDWLSGPGLYSWLLQNGLDHIELQLGYHARMARHWRDGGTAHVYSADAVLCKLGLHLSEIPDELWIEDPRKGRRITPEMCDEIKRRITELGQPIKVVAREVGCDPKTVRRYGGATA